MVSVIKKEVGIGQSIIRGQSPAMNYLLLQFPITQYRPPVKSLFLEPDFHQKFLRRVAHLALFVGGELAVLPAGHREELGFHAGFL